MNNFRFTGKWQKCYRSSPYSPHLVCPDINILHLSPGYIWPWYSAINWATDFIRILPIFPPVPIFCPWRPSRTPHCAWSLWSLVSPVVGNAFSDFVLHDLGRFEWRWPNVCNVSQIGFVWCFSYDQSGVMGFGEEDHWDEALSSSHYSRGYMISPWCHSLC